MSDSKRSGRFNVGIDLGTTNCVLAFSESPHHSSSGPADSGDAADAATPPVRRKAPEISVLPIPQRVGPEQTESRDSLPSFIYLPRDGEIESLRDRWTPEPAAGVVGVYARSQAADNPQRVVVAAKSWLSHGKGGDAILPWQSPSEVPQISALDCTTRLLSHLVAAWDDAHPDDPIADQNVVLTVPASFDPSARELTRNAAVRAGLPDTFVLLEEPQAAVYRWLHHQHDRWRESLQPGDVLLVVDVGGGTTDLTLISASQNDGDLELERLAVGNHLLLGGDNMDLALAHLAAGKFSSAGHQLDPWQSTSLWHACRAAKERLLAADGPDSQTISVLGRGSSLIGGTLTTEITKSEASTLIVDGFFPDCAANERPLDDPASGFQDVGLPFESDAAITRHVAAFLSDQCGPDASPVTPTHVLFNGGVFRSETLWQRLEQVIGKWCDQTPKTLGGVDDLDTAVAIGAAFYAHTKSSGGIRIRGGTARSYYVGIETAGLAIPGVPRPLRAVCVAPRGMEEGSEMQVPSQSVGVVVGRPARFRFFASTSREDRVGEAIDRPPTDDLYEAEPITVSLSSESADGQSFVPVQFVSRITELGMFELWCHSTAGDERWKMEFNARQ